MSFSSTASDDALALLDAPSRSHSAASTTSIGSQDAAAAAAGDTPLPADEATRRRESNRISAIRSRQKKKALMSAVHEVVEQQARSIADLEFKIGTLEAVLADARAAAAAAAAAAAGAGSEEVAPGTGKEQVQSLNQQRRVQTEIEQLQQHLESTRQPVQQHAQQPLQQLPRPAHAFASSSHSMQQPQSTHPHYQAVPPQQPSYSQQYPGLPLTPTFASCGLQDHGGVYPVGSPKDEDAIMYAAGAGGIGGSVGGDRRSAPGQPTHSLELLDSAMPPVDDPIALAAPAPELMSEFEAPAWP